MAWRLACVLLFVGCVQSQLVPCGELACPAGDVCTAGGCATRESAAACADFTDGDPCDTPAFTGGTCGGGACHALVCGDGFTDPRETCDDGNAVGGDGCAADCHSTETCGNGIVDPIKGEQCDDGIAGLSGDGCSSRCTNEVALWLTVGTGLGPKFRSPAIADRGTGRLLVFGGTSSTLDALDATWEWDGTTWMRRHPVTSPPARQAATMVYDEARHRVVLFGGRDQSGNKLADTWEWDGTTWEQRAPAISPPIRSDAMLAYDVDRAKTVLFGGLGVSGPIADTWEWDGTSWTERTPASPALSPAPRAHSGMVFDRARHATVLLGGTGGAIAPTGTWEWNGTTWTNVATEPYVGYVQLVFDKVRNRTVAVTMEPAQWEWTGAWTKVTTNPAPPVFVTHRSAAYDTVRQKIVLVGDTFTMGEVYEWNQTSWAQVTVLPGPTNLQAMAYDARRGRDVAIDLFTGTWEWDGEAWIRVSTTSPPLYNEIMAYFPPRAVAVLVGSSDTNGTIPASWTWDGATWHSEPSGGPAVRQETAMVYDAKRARLVLFGGIDSGGLRDDTWEWDGTTWMERVVPVRPRPRYEHAMAYDPVHQRTVLFGGDGVDSFVIRLGDTWEWDGDAWTELTPAVAPAARDNHSLLYDPLRRRVALTGRLGDYWEWDGTIWTERSLVVPTPRDGILVPDITGGLILGADPQRLRSVAETVPSEQCTVTADADGDGLAGCADPDCWTHCAPLCPPGLPCDAALPHCGDGACSPVETHALCPADCP